MGKEVPQRVPARIVIKHRFAFLAKKLFWQILSLLLSSYALPYKTFFARLGFGRCAWQARKVRMRCFFGYVSLGRQGPRLRLSKLLRLKLP